jgi:hypothetical protein
MGCWIIQTGPPFKWFLSSYALTLITYSLGAMASPTTGPLNLPPYQVQQLVESIQDAVGGNEPIDVRCAQALGESSRSRIQRALTSDRNQARTFTWGAQMDCSSGFLST